MKYPLPMRIMHWTMSIIVFCLLAVGIYMTGLPDDAPHKYDWYFWHKSFGLVILGLIFLRIFIRNTNTVPAPQDGISPLEVKVALITHKVLYALLLIVPLCGFVLSMTFMKSNGVSFFGLFTIPPFLPKSDAVSHLFGDLHEIFAFTLLAVVSIHVLAVIKHKFYDKNDVLKRML
ncbi:MAG: cytochrome b [Gammaproteobacteria bacterium]